MSEPSDRPTAKLPMNLPALRLPAGVSAEQHQFNQSVLQWIQMREGQQDSVGERVVLRRDLDPLGLISPNAGLAGPAAFPAGFLGKLAAQARAEDFAAFAAKIISTRVFQSLVARGNDASRFHELDERLQEILRTSILEEAAKRGAAIHKLEETVQQEGESRATAVQELTASLANATAGLRTAQSTTARLGRATAAQVTQVEARLDNFDGGGATVEQVLQAVADNITGLLAQYTIKVSAGGAMAGIGLAAEAPIDGPADSYIIMVANRFAFVQQDDVIGTGPGEVDPRNPGASRIPFGIDSDGVIYLNGQVRINAGGAQLQNMAKGAGMVTWNLRGTELVSPNSVKKAFNSGAWDSDAYSSESYVNGAFLSFSAAQTDEAVMVGLNADPSLDGGYVSIDYAWYATSSGTLLIYENGAVVSAHGIYNPSTVLSIVYDGDQVRYFIDGVLQREVDVAADLRFFLDSSFATLGATIKNVVFGPVGAKGAQGAQGPQGNQGPQGTPGLRGTVQAYAGGSVWSDATAASAVASATGTAYLLGGDTVTIHNGSTFAETRYWTGASWVPPGVVIDGNLLVQGTITTDKLFVNAATVASNSMVDGGNVSVAGLSSYGADTPVLSLTSTGSPVKSLGTVAIIVYYSVGVPHSCLFSAQLVVDGVAYPPLNEATAQFHVQAGGSGNGSMAKITIPIVDRRTPAAGAHTYSIRITALWKDVNGNQLVAPAASFINVISSLLVEENKV